jgi:hypothetical protein
MMAEVTWRRWHKSRGWVGVCVGVLLMLSSGAPGAVFAQPGEEGAAPGEEESPEQAAEEARRALDLFLRQERIIFRPGEFAFELGMFYRTDTDEEFISVGALRPLAKITNRGGFATLTARVGLLRDVQFDVTLPIGVTKQEIDLGVARFRRDEAGLGDVTGRLRYGLLAERGARPDVILDVTATSGTTSVETLLGSGFWRVGGGVSLVKTLDPVVLFGRLGYTAVLERAGRDPADQFSYLFGTGFSLTDRVSVSARVSGIAGGRAQVNEQAIPGTNLDAISMQFALTTRLTRRLYVEPFVSIGLTEDATDAVVGVSLVGTRFRPLALLPGQTVP